MTAPPVAHKMPLPELPRERRSSPEKSPLVSCYGYSGGYRWHWRQTYDSFPAQPVVVVHGAFLCGLSLAPLAERIASWAPVLVPDLPGYGLSTGTARMLSVQELAAALSEWMKLAGAGHAHLLGVSFGCQIAAELAARFPHKVRSLTLLGPPIDPAAYNFQLQLTRLVADIPREPVALWAKHIRLALGHGIGAVRVMLGDRIESKLPHIGVPALVLRGRADPIAPEPWIRRVAALLPEACSLTLPAGAHGVHFTHPALVASAMRKFTLALGNPR